MARNILAKGLGMSIRRSAGVNTADSRLTNARATFQVGNGGDSNPNCEKIDRDFAPNGLKIRSSAVYAVMHLSLSLKMSYSV